MELHEHVVVHTLQMSGNDVVLCWRRQAVDETSRPMTSIREEMFYRWWYSEWMTGLFHADFPCRFEAMTFNFRIIRIGSWVRWWLNLTKIFPFEPALVFQVETKAQVQLEKSRFQKNIFISTKLTSLSHTGMSCHSLTQNCWAQKHCQTSEDFQKTSNKMSNIKIFLKNRIHQYTLLVINPILFSTSRCYTRHTKQSCMGWLNAN